MEADDNLSDDPDTRRAQEWLLALCKEHGVEWDGLDKSTQNGLVRSIPCNVRCWRVGGPVDTTPGEPCVECGRPVPVQTLWERLLDNAHDPMDPSPSRAVEGT